MNMLPDSGMPPNLFQATGFPTKPAEVSQATWEHLCQRYHPRGLLGTGKQAVVYSFEDPRHPQRPIAIKIYRDRTDASMKLFRNEIRNLSSHLPSSVVKYYDFNDDESLQPYLVLEQIKGLTLAQWLVQKPTFAQRMELIEKLAFSLQQLHDAQLVFGDMSDKNILLTTSDAIRWIDLAGAKDLVPGRHSQDSSINICTPSCFPLPEGELPVREKARTSQATDIYGLAAISYLVLTGRTVSEVQSEWNEDSDSRLPEAKESLASSPIETTLQQANVPNSLRKIVLRGLEPPKRYGLDRVPSILEARQFGKELQQWRSRQGRFKERLWLSTSLTLTLLFVTWWAFSFRREYQNSQLAFETRRYEVLEARTNTLANRSHPSIQKLLQSVHRMSSARADQLRQGDTHGAMASLQKMTRQLEQVIETSIALEPLLRWRETVSSELVSGVDSAIISWDSSNPYIQSHLTRLAMNNRAIEDELGDGQLLRAGSEIASLQKQVLELEQSNRQSLALNDLIDQYSRIQLNVPDRLRGEEEYLAVSSLGSGGIEDWKRGKWETAELHLAQASQRLESWLRPLLTHQEKVAFEATANRSRIESAKAEIEQIREELRIAQQGRNGLQTTVATLNEHLTENTKALERAQDTERAAVSEKNKLAQNLDVAQQQATQLQNEKKQLQEELTQQRAESLAWKKKHENTETDLANWKSLYVKLSNEQKGLETQLASSQAAVKQNDERAARAESTLIELQKMAKAKKPSPPTPGYWSEVWRTLKQVAFWGGGAVVLFLGLCIVIATIAEATKKKEETAPSTSSARSPAPAAPAPTLPVSTPMVVPTPIANHNNLLLNSSILMAKVEKKELIRKAKRKLASLKELHGEHSIQACRQELKVNQLQAELKGLTTHLLPPLRPNSFKLPEEPLAEFHKKYPHLRYRKWKP